MVAPIKRRLSSSLLFYYSGDAATGGQLRLQGEEAGPAHQTQQGGQGQSHLSRQQCREAEGAASEFEVQRRGRPNGARPHMGRLTRPQAPSKRTWREIRRGITAA